MCIAKSIFFSTEEFSVLHKQICKMFAEASLGVLAHSF